MKFVRIGICFVLSSMLMFITACSNMSDAVSQNSPCPYATEAQLDAVANLSGDFISYKVARTLGMLEMADFEDVSGWSHNAVLSDTPVIIWETDDKPKYYEFHVIDNGKDVGYVTCNVSKKAGDPVAFVGSGRKDYPESESRSVISNATKVYNANYPCTEIRSSARTADTEEDEMSEEEAYAAWLETLSDEEIAENGTTREEALGTFIANKGAEEKRLENLWALIDEETENLERLTDEEIIKAITETYSEDMEGSSRSALITNSSASSDKKIDYVFVEPYATNKGNRRLEKCVPSVLEFICQNYVKDNNLAITDDEIRAAILNEMGDKSVLFLLENSKWKNSLSKATGGNLTETSSLLHVFDTITSSLKSNGLPVISCRSGGSNIFGIFKEGHCRAITGTCKVQNLVNRKFLWIKWTEWEKNGYYYMWDNTIDLNGPNTTNDVNFGVYSNKENKHFWEKDGTWFYCGTKTVKQN